MNLLKVLALLFFILTRTAKLACASSSSDAIVDKVNSNQEGRRLSTTCATFEHDSVSPNNKDNWKTANGGTTLNTFCDKNAHDCCNSGGDVNANNECTLWNTAVKYRICSGACKENSACQRIARNASGGGSVTIHSNSCIGRVSCHSIGYQLVNANIEIFSDSCKDGSYACADIAYSASSGYVKIHSNSCRGPYSCNNIGYNIQSDLNVEVGIHSCLSDVFHGFYCAYIGYNALSINSIQIPANQCNQKNDKGVGFKGKCDTCGFYSVFNGAFVPTNECCSADGYYGSAEDEACNYTPPSDEPNPCKNVDCSNRGECRVLTHTKAECQCENTFIQSEDKLDCVCPSDWEFVANHNRCFPLTAPPTKTPTSSPTLAPTATPTSSPTQTAVVLNTCADDETTTFSLIKNETIKVGCDWLTKNSDREKVRKERYCGLNRVKNICKRSCDFCTCKDDPSYRFDLLNVTDTTHDCSWLTRNWENKEKRIANYCKEDFDSGALINNCTKSCGLCTSE